MKMQVLIIEDEQPAADRLISLIQENEPDWKIAEVLDSIESSVNYLSKDPKIDLIFMDIHLADGYSFEIFKSVTPNCPVIFATAYDQYALDAFKVNGLDYILKPLKKDEIKRVIEKFKNSASSIGLDVNALQELIRKSGSNEYKKRFMAKIGDRYLFIKASDISYIVSEDGYSFIITFAGKRHLMDQTVEQFSKDLDPEVFFQISRKHIVNLEAIQEIASYFNKRLKLQLTPQNDQEFVVSRPRVKEFRRWIDR